MQRHMLLPPLDVRDRRPREPDTLSHLALGQPSLPSVRPQEFQTQTTAHQIPRGETAVPTLETELGITEVEQLWVIKKDGTRKPLASHEKTDVQARDRYQAVVKGGIS